jgi:hypothetical protein
MFSLASVDKGAPTTDALTLLWVQSSIKACLGFIALATCTVYYQWHVVLSFAVERTSKPVNPAQDYLLEYSTVSSICLSSDITRDSVQAFYAKLLFRVLCQGCFVHLKVSVSHCINHLLSKLFTLFFWSNLTSFVTPYTSFLRNLITRSDSRQIIHRVETLVCRFYTDWLVHKNQARNLTQLELISLLFIDSFSSVRKGISFMLRPLHPISN